MSSNNEQMIEKIKMCKAEIEKYPYRLGDSIYVKVKKGEEYEMLDINSDELFDYFFTSLIDKDILISKNCWKYTLSTIKSKFTAETLKALHSRIGMYNDKIYYDLIDFSSPISHFIEISNGTWNIVSNEIPNFEWNPFQKEQVLPNKESWDVEILLQYLNLEEGVQLLYLVYVISCFIPDIQHPILNVTGEAGTGKSTLCKITKELVDPSRSTLNDFSDGKDGIGVLLSHNYITVFDNIESMPKKLNQTFCMSVTEGATVKRQLYSNNTMVEVPLKSIVVMNGITSAIRREDLMSRTIFVHTKEMNTFKESGELLKRFQEQKPEILGAIFNVLSLALVNKKKYKVEGKFRMMEFASYGYAIAESMKEGLGKVFLQQLKNNEDQQLSEIYINEPIVPLVIHYMRVYGTEGISKTMTVFYNDLIKASELLPEGRSLVRNPSFPKSSATFGKKIRTLSSIFRKNNLQLEIVKTKNREHLSKIDILWLDEEEIEAENCGDEDKKLDFKRIPITGIRKPIILKKVI